MMFVQIDRLELQMKAAGFHRWLAEARSGEFSWSRPSALAELFEHIWVIAYGDKQNVVGSFSAVSVIAGPDPCDGLYVDRYHDSLCSEKVEFQEPSGEVVRDYHTRIRNRKQAVTWETQLGEGGPSECLRLTSEVGERLLEVSDEARRAAKSYWRMLRGISAEANCDYLEQHLRKKCTRDQEREADRLADAAVVRSQFFAAYQAASIAIQLFGKDVEGTNWPTGGKYSANNPIMWRLSILADLLLRDGAAELFGDERWRVK